jgi:putative endonuclease
MKNERKRALTRGRRAESLACWLLRAKGYRILARNWRCPQGEIDILARRGPVLAAVEVKRRDEAGTAMESIAPRPRRRIERALGAFLARHPDLSGLSIRFDAVTVGAWSLPRHLAQAWRPERG